MEINRNWRKTTVTIEDDDQRFGAYDLGTSWNGFTDYAVTEDAWMSIRARMAALGMDDEAAQNWVRDFPAGPMGFYDLGGGAFVILNETGDACPHGYEISGRFGDLCPTCNPQD